jgi:streptogramin lyase
VHLLEPSRTRSSLIAVALGCALMPALAGGSARAAVTRFPLPAGSVPQAMAFGPDGNLWLARPGGDQPGFVERMTPNGAVMRFTAGITGSPAAIAAGPDGNMWFTEYGLYLGTGSLARITPAGVVTEFLEADLEPGTEVLGVTGGPDGRIWFTTYRGGLSNGDGTVGSVTTAGGDMHRYDIAPPEYLANNTRATDIVTGPDGNLWFTLRNAGANTSFGVGRSTTAGVVSRFSDNDTSAVAAGPDGNVWAVSNDGGDYGMGSLLRVTPAGDLSHVNDARLAPPQGFVDGLAVGSDGRIWTGGVDPGEYSDGNTYLAKVDPGGATSYACVPGEISEEAFAAGPDGAVWVAGFDADGGPAVWRVPVDTPATCPKGGGSPGDGTFPGGFRVDTVAPRITHLRAQPARFRSHHGTTLRFRVSERVRARVAVARLRPGRHARSVGSVWRTVHGRARVRLRRVKEKWLAPGRYRIKVTARDTSGNRSRHAATVTVRVRR